MHRKRNKGKRDTTTRPEGDSIVSPEKVEKREDTLSPHKSRADTADTEELEFEDEFEDEVEDAEMLRQIQEEVEKEENQNMDIDEQNEEHMADEAEAAAAEEMLQEENNNQQKEKTQKKVWKPGQPLGEDETLEYDSSAYDMLHSLTVEWPCLSFDILRDTLGFQRSRYPHTLYLVAGTQADKPQNNAVVVMKISQLHKTKHDNEESDEEEEEEDETLDDDPIVEYRSFRHPGGINRIRAMASHPEIVATWADTAHVNVWNLKSHIQSLDTPGITIGQTKPAFTFKDHKTEGFALDWSSTKEGNLLTGSCDGAIHLWEYDNSQWTVSSTPFKGHTQSVEDIQWSPKEVNVFASCSVDRTIRLWDIRVKTQSALSVEAHPTDINVINWNRQSDFLLVSGCDDGSFKIWDLRNFKPGTPVAHMKWHNKAVTAVEWHPTDAPVLAIAGEDNQVSTWDMSLEADPEAANEGDASVDFEIPPQLLFCHQGQNQVKEIHWHPQIPGVIVSTASDGFNIYKSCNV